MNKIALSLISIPALALAACSGGDDEAAMPENDVAMTEPAAPGTIVEVAQGDGQFTTLVSAITAAGLGETLSAAGPYTVFAPSDAAFAKLPEGTLDTLTMPENKDKLSGILTYHVVSGETMAAALTAAIADAGEGGAELTTVNGAKLVAKAEGGKVTLTDAAGNTVNVTATDIDASNGVIHVIDGVLMPE